MIEPLADIAAPLALVLLGLAVCFGAVTSAVFV